MPILLSVLVFWCMSMATGANGASGGGVGEGVAEVGEEDSNHAMKLDIYESVLFNDPMERRIEIAMLMLQSNDGAERAILIKALGADDNPEARAAVCKALNRLRTEGKAIEGRRDFVQPLVDILERQSGEAATLAAEATQIFSYSEVSAALKRVAYSPSQAVGARVNAISALKLQPDKRAMVDLMNLLDEGEPAVVEAATQALQSLQISVRGKNAAQIGQMKEELNLKTIDDFYRGLLRLQQVEYNKLKTENQRWQKLCFELLDQAYASNAGDADRSDLLDRWLGGSDGAAKLWALEKVDQWRKAKSTIPAQIGERLIRLISDPDPQVRLKTATLLSMMGELDSAQALLDQIKIEQDGQIKLELFRALGKACYDGLLETAVHRTPAEVRDAALEMAAGYLKGTNEAGIREGAKVMGKLLELDGLSDAEVQRYFSLLSGVYKEQTDANLRGEILGAMGQLCAQSVFKAQAAAVFGPIFRVSLGDKAEVVRQQSLDGLIYIDKAQAMVICRERGFATDASAKIRNSVIALAEEVGGREDLEWLSEKLGPGPEGKAAWEAMLAILKRSPEMMNNWVGRLEAQHSSMRVSDEQMISLLDAAERIGNGADGGGAEVRAIQEKLAALYTKTGRYEQAAAYWGKLGDGAETAAAKKAYSARLLEVYLKQSNADAAVQMLNYYVQEGDMGANDVIVKAISGFIAEMPASYDREVLRGIFRKVELPKEPRSEWQRQVQRWRANLGSPAPVVEVEQPGN